MSLLNQKYNRGVRPSLSAPATQRQDVLYQNPDYYAQDLVNDHWASETPDTITTEESSAEIQNLLELASTQIDKIMQSDDALALLDAELKNTEWLLALINNLRQARTDLIKRQKILIKTIDNLKGLTYSEPAHVKSEIVPNDLDSVTLPTSIRDSTDFSNDQ